MSSSAAGGASAESNPFASSVRPLVADRSDTHAIIAAQEQVMAQQDHALDGISRSLGTIKHMGLQIKGELDMQVRARRAPRTARRPRPTPPPARAPRVRAELSARRDRARRRQHVQRHAQRAGEDGGAAQAHEGLQVDPRDRRAHRRRRAPPHLGLQIRRQGAELTGRLPPTAQAVTPPGPTGHTHGSGARGSSDPAIAQRRSPRCAAGCGARPRCCGERASASRARGPVGRVVSNRVTMTHHRASQCALGGLARRSLHGPVTRRRHGQRATAVVSHDDATTRHYFLTRS